MLAKLEKKNTGWNVYVWCVCVCEDKAIVCTVHVNSKIGDKVRRRFIFFLMPHASFMNGNRIAAFVHLEGKPICSQHRWQNWYTVDCWLENRAHQSAWSCACDVQLKATGCTEHRHTHTHIIRTRPLVRNNSNIAWCVLIWLQVQHKNATRLARKKEVHRPVIPNIVQCHEHHTQRFLLDNRSRTYTVFPSWAAERERLAGRMAVAARLTTGAQQQCFTRCDHRRSACTISIAAKCVPGDPSMSKMKCYYRI